MHELCTFLSCTCAVAVRRGLWYCPSPTTAAKASRTMVTVQCRIWPSTSLGSRLFPSGWSWCSNFLTVAVIPCSPALPRSVIVAWDKPVWWNCPPVTPFPLFRFGDIVSDCLLPVSCGAECKVMETCCNIWGEGEKKQTGRCFKSVTSVHS